jgi:hypothetical protein
VKNDKDAFMKNKNLALTSLEQTEGLRPENLELIRIKQSHATVQDEDKVVQNFKMPNIDKIMLEQTDPKI